MAYKIQKKSKKIHLKGLVRSIITQKTEEINTKKGEEDRKNYPYYYIKSDKILDLGTPLMYNKI